MADTLHEIASKTYSYVDDQLPLPLDETSPLLRKSNEEGNRMIRYAIYISLAVNFALLLGKIVALILSHSLAVVASVLDSVLDLVAQMFLWYANAQSQNAEDNFPVGKSRLSPIGVLILATLMFAGAVEVVHESVDSIVEGIEGKLEAIEFGNDVILTLAITISLKIILYLFCRYGSWYQDVDSIQALADDHRNDVLTNLAALLCGYVAFHKPSLWFTDPVGAILLSIYIAINWILTGSTAMRKLVGQQAEPEQIQHIKDVIERYEICGMTLDRLRAYHSGDRLVVEVEIVMDPDSQLKVVHNRSLVMQQDIEKLRFVERAFVHVDYKKRDKDEHSLSISLH